MDKTVLIFPAGMPLALAFLKRAKLEPGMIIGASSLAYDPVRPEYPDWLSLPYVNDDGFNDALRQAVNDHSISEIYSPHPVVWDYLNRALKGIAPAVSLINGSPVNAEMEVFRGALQRTQNVFDHPLPIASAKTCRPDLTMLQIAALYRHVEGIPGMCDHEKLRALYEIARSCPVGDVVEIGTWWGKSAFILLRLAQDFGIGRVLCVDPWSDEGLISEGAHELVASVCAQVSAEEAFNAFLLNLLPYANGNINFLRMPSVEGSARYQGNREVQTPEFGDVRYAGCIAILHIDGNHSYENANADLNAWRALVMPGGWIVLDDYTWPFGDGPKRVGDEFLTLHGEEIYNTFVMGGALFIQLNV